MVDNSVTVTIDVVVPVTINYDPSRYGARDYVVKQALAAIHVDLMGAGRDYGSYSAKSGNAHC